MNNDSASIENIALFDLDGTLYPLTLESQSRIRKKIYDKISKFGRRRQLL